tara:strand:+ start:107 stop:370 length:264 start_codon:yes stop_codon:yes gene_type:complete
MKIILIVMAALVLGGCVAWNPQLGMTYPEFQEHWDVSDNLDSPRLVADDGTTRVYETDNIFYYFVDGQLDRIDQGQRFEKRVRVTIE